MAGDAARLISRIVAGRMPPVEYRYELRQGNEIVATGHLSREEPFEVGEQLEIGGGRGTVLSIEPTLGARELRLVVQLGRGSGED